MDFLRLYLPHMHTICILLHICNRILFHIGISYDHIPVIFRPKNCKKGTILVFDPMQISRTPDHSCQGLLISNTPRMFGSNERLLDS